MGKFKNKIQGKKKAKGNSKKKPQQKKVEKKLKIKTKKNMETKIKAIVEKTGVSEEVAKLNIIDSLNAKKNLKNLLTNQTDMENVKSLHTENSMLKSLKRKKDEDNTLKSSDSSVKISLKEPLEQNVEEVEEEEESDDDSKKKNAEEIESAVQSPKQNDEEIESTLFVGNLPQNIKKQQVANLFQPFGSVKSVRIRTALGKKIFKHKMRHETDSLIAFVKMDTPENVEKALQLTGTVFHDRHIRVTKAKLDSTINEDSTKRTIFVGNLRYSATEDKLHELFSSCGEIESVRTVKNEKGCSGVAFVCFKKPESVGLSIELRNTMLDERPINVERHMKNKEINSRDRNERHKNSNVDRKDKDIKKKGAFKGIKMGRKKEYIKKRKQANSREKRLAKKIAPRVR